MAEQILARKVESIRSIFSKSLAQTSFDSGEKVLAMTAEGFIKGLQSLGIDDLSQLERDCVLKVLTKPDLNGQISFPELLQILENLGLVMEDDACEIGGRDDEDNSGEEKQANKNTVNLTKLDDKSIKILTLLMMKLMEMD